jgi:hypothetical protein
MKYLLIMQIDPTVLENLTAEQSKAIEAGHGAFIDTITKSGELIGTQALADPSRSAVVASRGGTTVVTDGPFVEAKEYMGGFYVVDTETEERVRELAAMIPDTAIEGLAVEIRPVVFTMGFGLTEPEAS